MTAAHRRRAPGTIRARCTTGVRRIARGLGLTYFGRKSWPRRNRAVLGLGTVGATLVALVLLAGATASGPTGHQRTELGAVPPSIAISAQPAGPVTSSSAAPARATRPIVPPAPVKSSAVGKPVGRAVPSTPPANAAAGTTCFPLADGGACYQPEEPCREADHNSQGIAANGEWIVCIDKGGWRWKPSG